MRKSSVVILIILFLNYSFYSQDASSKINFKTKKIILISSSSVLTLGSIAYLNQSWYQQYNTGRFHFFNDNKEWLQMDKAGHTFSSFQMSRWMMDAFENAGYDKGKSIWLGGNIGLFYFTAIECMDGFSRGWGFSWGDELSNILGTSVAISQKYFWNEQRTQLKYSYSPSGLAKYNPDLLGKDSYTQILKDYNAQTYWLSINPHSFFKKETKFPRWLNFALGYSAYGMIGGNYNNITVYDKEGNTLHYERERRFYLSLDVDLTRVKIKNKFLTKVFSLINILKFPAPTLGISVNGLNFYPIYY